MSRGDATPTGSVMAEPALLFTPGPLTTRIETREAMLRDWGSREPHSSR